MPYCGPWIPSFVTDGCSSQKLTLYSSGWCNHFNGSQSACFSNVSLIRVNAPSWYHGAVSTGSLSVSSAASPAATCSAKASSTAPVGSRFTKMFGNCSANFRMAQFIALPRGPDVWSVANRI